MLISFDKIHYGHQYERPYLARLWGYKSYNAISRGVVTPIGTKYIILFVTRNKQKTLTQYNDYLDENMLHWEGEEKHSSDKRIIDASISGDQIHLFYREYHHSPFIYFGQIELKEYWPHINRPSRFMFYLKHRPDIFDDIKTSLDELRNLKATEQDALVKSRIGQGVFRYKLVEMWHGCSVTGLSNMSLLRASHIKPWRYSTNYERLDPMNGLLLIPVLDHLFDKGYVTFEDSGMISLSQKLSGTDVAILRLDRSWQLRNTPNDLKRYLNYHRSEVFDRF